MSLYYIYKLWMRLMYHKYEHCDPKVLLSVDRFMGLCLHMTHMQPRVTYLITLLLCNDLDNWLFMSIMSCNEWYYSKTVFRDYDYGDVIILFALMNYIWVAYSFWSPTFSRWCSKFHKAWFQINDPFKHVLNNFIHGFHT